MELVLLAFGFVIFLIIVFILTRKFWLWYWKIDHRLSLIHDQVRLLESIDKKMGAIINQGTDLDPEEIPNDPLYISSDNDEEQRVKEKIHSTDREPPIWLLLQVVLLLAILVISVFITLKGS